MPKLKVRRKGSKPLPGAKRIKGRFVQKMKPRQKGEVRYKLVPKKKKKDNRSNKFKRRFRKRFA